MLYCTNNLYPIPLGVRIHDCLSNMRDKLPVFRPEHPKLCWCKHTADFGMFLSAHGCAWKFWCGRSSGSKFCIESTFYVCKRPACRLWVADIKKIDAKPIFTVPDMLPNLAIMSGTVKISVVLIFFSCNNNKWHCILLLTIIADRPCNLGVKLCVQRFFWAKQWVCTFGFARQICMQKQISGKFFWFVLRQMFFRDDIIYMHTCPAANFGAQTPSTT